MDFTPTVIGFVVGMLMGTTSTSGGDLLTTALVLIEHKVPYNPLHAHGYPNIGCYPCTSQVKPGEDDRAGRWRGTERNECGLHEPAVPTRLHQEK